MELMKSGQYIQVNRAMWNQTAEVYEAEGLESFLAVIQRPNFTTFDEVERGVFLRIGLDGSDVAQLGCNNGRELISVKKAGAGRCVGFDLSEKFIDQARQLAQVSGHNAEFVCTSIYDIDPAFDDSFDVIYVTVGVLGWLPELPGFFKVVERLLRSGGYFFLYDQHPILGMFDPTKVLEIDSSYFRQEPFVDDALPDYLDPTQAGSATSYWFQHTLSEIMGLCLRSGLAPKHFEEHERDLSNTYRAFQNFDYKLPLSYSLLAQKSPKSS